MAMSYARFPIFFLVIAGLLCIWPATGRSEDKQAGSVYEKVLERGSIRCGYLVWPPYITKDPNTLQLGGINYLIMEEIGKTLGLKIEWVEEVGAGEAIQGLNTGRYDVMCATLWPDQARLKSSLMTRPTFYSTVYAVVRADDNRFDGKRENMNAPDVTFTGIEGDVTKSLAMESFPKAKMLAMPESADGSLLLQNIVSKKADIALIDRGMLKTFIKANGSLLKLVAGIEPIGGAFGETLVVRKGEVEMKLLLDNAIGILIDKNAIAELGTQFPDNGYLYPLPSWKAAPENRP